MRIKSQFWYIVIMLIMTLNYCSAQSVGKVHIELNSYLDGKLLLFNSQFALVDSLSLDSGKVSVIDFKAIGSDFYFIAVNRNNKVFQYFTPYFLAPNDSLFINHTERNFTISGNASIINQFTKDERYNIKSNNYKRKLYLEPLEAVAVIDSVRSAREIYLNEFAEQTKVSDTFMSLHKEWIYQNWCLDYFKYLAYHNYYAHREFEYLSMDSLPFNFKDSLRFNSKFNFTSTYSDMLKAYIELRFQETTSHLNDSIKYEFQIRDFFNLIESELTGIDKEIAYEAFASELAGQMRGVDQDLYFNTITPVADLMAVSQREYLKYSFNTRFGALKRIAIKNTAPNFTLKDIDGKDVSLSDYRGKIVYLNFWGTWCPPCIASVPKHIELHQKYKDNENIVFLNVALEYDAEDIDRWKKFVHEKGYTGVHVVAEKQFNNKALAGYLLNSAPTYMIVGKSGEIIETRAKPPYYNIEQIDVLLK